MYSTGKPVMLSLIQNILLSAVFGALGATILIFSTRQPVPVIGTVDTVAIIDPLKKEMVNNIFNQKEVNDHSDKLRRLDEIITELGKKGITLIEKKAIITKGLMDDYTQEIQNRMGE